MELRDTLDAAASVVLIGTIGYGAYGYLAFDTPRGREEKAVGSVIVFGSLAGMFLLGLSRSSLLSARVSR